LREGQRYSEGYGSEEEYAYRTHRRFRRMHRYTEGPGYAPDHDAGGPPPGDEPYGPEAEQGYGPEDHGGPGYGDEPEGSANSEAGYSSSGQMSINSPAALDSWQGYGVDCPERHNED
jgi:hypothetical protein